ncbi:MAG: hypothetical protein FWB87_04375 [Defluviitaleaceae bacterium]|nr:hypothetical protein [Defluviitaleaceae bacterium]
MNLSTINNAATLYASSITNSPIRKEINQNSQKTHNNDSSVVRGEAFIANNALSQTANASGHELFDDTLRTLQTVIINDACRWSGSGFSDGVGRSGDALGEYFLQDRLQSDFHQWFMHHGLRNDDGSMTEKGKTFRHGHDHGLYETFSSNPLRNTPPSQAQLQLAEQLGLDEAQLRKMNALVTGQFNNFMIQHDIVTGDMGQKILDQIFNSMQELFAQFHQNNNASS